MDLQIMHLRGAAQGPTSEGVVTSEELSAHTSKEVCRIRLGAFSSGSVIHTIPYHTISNGSEVPIFLENICVVKCSLNKLARRRRRRRRH